MSYHQQATIIIIMSTQIIVIEIIIFLWSILTVLLSRIIFVTIILFCGPILYMPRKSHTTCHLLIQPCTCLCLGFALQRTRALLFLITIRHDLHLNLREETVL